jgi:hypothetical protein
MFVLVAEQFSRYNPVQAIFDMTDIKIKNT